jgi:hypothetical protein
MERFLIAYLFDLFLSLIASQSLALKQLPNHYPNKHMMCLQVTLTSGVPMNARM